MANVTGGNAISSTAQIADEIIVNADISNSAAIDDAKLAEINDANKVSGAAFKSLSSIPVGAGVIPAANLPSNVRALVSTIFENTTRFIITLVGSGSTSVGTPGLQMAPGGTSGSSAEVSLRLVNGAAASVWSGSPFFSVSLYMNNINLASGVGHAWYGVGYATVAGTGITFPYSHVGFKIIKTGGVMTLYGTQGNGASESVTSALTTVANLDYLELMFKINGTTSVDYYWRQNAGALSSATNLATNMPTGTTGAGYIQMGLSNVSTAVEYSIIPTALSYER